MIIDCWHFTQLSEGIRLKYAQAMMREETLIPNKRLVKVDHTIPGASGTLPIEDIPIPVIKEDKIPHQAMAERLKRHKAAVRKRKYEERCLAKKKKAQERARVIKHLERSGLVRPPRPKKRKRVVSKYISRYYVVRDGALVETGILDTRHLRVTKENQDG